jgi:hypothetical protein
VPESGERNRPEGFFKTLDSCDWIIRHKLIRLPDSADGKNGDQQIQYVKHRQDTKSEREIDSLNFWPIRERSVADHQRIGMAYARE